MDVLGTNSVGEVVDVLAMPHTDQALPTDISLAQNFPNPFNPSTTIMYAVPAQAAGQPLTLAVYDLLGQRVRHLDSESALPGTHRVVWDGRDDHGQEVASGVYIYQLRARNYTATRKMILSR